MARSPIIGVMGPGEQATSTERKVAYELGQAIAIAGWILLTGGRNQGVMDAASRGAKSQGGLTIGILPQSDREGLSAAVDIPILTGMGNARNVINVLTSDGVIACGVGAGTVSEIALAIKVKRPVILLQVPPTAQAFFQSLAPDQVWVADHVPMAIALVQQVLRRM